MSDEEQQDQKQEQRIQKLREVNVGKGVAKDGQSIQVREGANASAPANFTLPEPIKMPPPPKSADTKKTEKE